MYIGKSADTWEEGCLGWKGEEQVKKDFKEDVLKDAQLALVGRLIR